MKENKAPEKIYVDSKAIGDDISTTVHTKRQDYSTCTEYIRTDAFIEKACDWFRRIDYDDSMPPFETTEEFIEGFKKAMKL